MYYFAKRRVDLFQVFSRVRGGSSLRDIGRELDCSRTAVSNAILRLGRQAMSMHIQLMSSISGSGALSFDGLMSAIATRDYCSHITTLGDTAHELIVAMTQSVTDRGGPHNPIQQRRITARRSVWRPTPGDLSESICLLIKELPRWVGRHRIFLDTDEHPIYQRLIESDMALRWFDNAGLLTVRRTSSKKPRTTTNPLFLMNYIDRMMRHRMVEHHRQTIALARNSSMQMHRMWIFAWDHNARQPARVAGLDRRCRAELAGVDSARLLRMRRQFFRQRASLRGLPMPESIRSVWNAELPTPPTRWKTPQIQSGPAVPAFARLDLQLANPQDP